MIHANRYRKMKLPIPVVTIFFLSDLGKLIFIPFAMKQVTRKRIIINPIDVHLCCSSCSIPSKRNVAIVPPISANAIRNQKSLLARFFTRLSCAGVVSGSAVGISCDLSGSYLRFFEISPGSDVHFPTILSSSSCYGSGCDFSVDVVCSCSENKSLLISS